MKLLAALLAFIALPALAEIQYSTTPGGTYAKLDGAVLPSGSQINIRNLPCPMTKPWASTYDGAPVGIPESQCPIEAGGDNFLLALSDGSHTVTMSDGVSAPLVAKFTVSSNAPPATPLIDWSVKWTAPTQNTDGTPISCALTYAVRRGLQPGGPFSAAWSGSTTTATVTAASGQQCFKVSALCGLIESEPSPSVCQTKTVTPGSPPVPPVIVGGSPKALALVSGATAGTRAAYGAISTGSRGPKAGDLQVGPVSGDFQRLECDLQQAFNYGGNRYAKVTDPAAGALAGTFTTGCYSVGAH